MAFRLSNSKRRPAPCRWRAPQLEQLEARELFAGATDHVPLLDVMQFSHPGLVDIPTQRNLPVCSAKRSNVSGNVSADLVVPISWAAVTGDEVAGQNVSWEALWHALPDSQWNNLLRNELVINAESVRGQGTFGSADTDGGANGLTDRARLDCEMLPDRVQRVTIHANVYSASIASYNDSILAFGLLQGPSVAITSARTEGQDQFGVTQEVPGTTETPWNGFGPGTDVFEYEPTEPPPTSSGVMGPAAPPVTNGVGEKVGGSPSTSDTSLPPAPKQSPPVMMDIGATVSDRSARALRPVEANTVRRALVGGEPLEYFRMDAAAGFVSTGAARATASGFKHASRDRYFAFMLNDNTVADSVASSLAADRDGLVMAAAPVGETVPPHVDAADQVHRVAHMRARSGVRPEPVDRARTADRRVSQDDQESESRDADGQRASLLRMITPVLTWLVTAAPQLQTEDQVVVAAAHEGDPLAGVEPVEVDAPRESSGRKRSIAGSLLFVSLITARQVLRSPSEETSKNVALSCERLS